MITTNREINELVQGHTEEKQVEFEFSLPINKIEQSLTADSSQFPDTAFWESNRKKKEREEFTP